MEGAQVRKFVRKRLENIFEHLTDSENIFAQNTTTFNPSGDYNSRFHLEHQQHQIEVITDTSNI